MVSGGMSTLTATTSVIMVGKPDPERLRKALEYLDNCLYRKHNCPYVADVRRGDNAVTNERRMETHSIRTERNAVAGW